MMHEREDISPSEAVERLRQSLEQTPPAPRVRYFFDTEFIEDGETIDLISIGIVCEDGREYYAINKDCDFSKANAWVRENVLAKLPPRNARPPDGSTAWMWQWRSREEIREGVAIFCGCFSDTTYSYTERLPILGPLLRFWGIPCNPKQTIAQKFFIPDGAPKPEFWAYYADYDWVVFCQLFGTMMNLPQGFPMFCNDLKQEFERIRWQPVFESTNEHHALSDARWVKEAWESLQSRA